LSVVFNHGVYEIDRQSILFIEKKGEAMLDQNEIANIRQTAIATGAADLKKRDRILREEIGFRVADEAEYVLLASCVDPFIVPTAMKAFGGLLEYFAIDYTLLNREYCCGNRTFQQALRAKKKDDEHEADRLAQEFQAHNLQQVREVGATKIIAFCPGCDMTYKRFQVAQSPGRLPGTTGQEAPIEILWYPTLLARFFNGGKLELQADYFSGCHMLYRRLSPSTPVDLESPLKVLNQIEGLELNQWDHSLCCAVPEEKEALVASIRTRTVITPCATCATRLQETLKDRGDYRILMLPEVVQAAVSGNSV
jgi:Fe-S oxidoreductase